MEKFLLLFTVIFLFFIGAGFFSLLLSLARRISVLLLEDEAEDEARYEALEDEALQDGENALAGELSAEEKKKRWARYGLKELLGKDYVCDSCGQVLKVYELIPVFGFLFAQGRCRYCGARIRSSELLSELLGGTLLVLVFFRFGSSGMLAQPFALSTVLDISAAMTLRKMMALLLLFLVMGLLFLISMIDLETMIIPNGLSLAMFVMGIFGVFLFPDVPWHEHLIGMMVVSLPMLLITLLIPGAFGGGDVKLMAGAGLLLGWKLTLLAAFVGIIGGGIFGTILLATKKAGRKAHFAFGPFLCIGIVAAVLGGYSILSGYLTLTGGNYGNF